MDKLKKREILRIDCGGDQEHMDPTDGRAWWRDSFFHGGHREEQTGRTPVRGASGRRVYQTVRSFNEAALASGYRVPLPTGRYRLRLHLAQFFKPYGAWIRFDVVAEDTTLRDLAPGRTGPAIEILELEVDVRDGFLELNLVPQRFGVPWEASIAALEIEPVR